MDENNAQNEELLAELLELRREVKHLRRNLRQVERQAQVASRAKTEFLANMSHEIRTPMAAIVGYIELVIEEGDLSRAPPSRSQYLLAVKRNSQHLMRLLDDILDLAKIESGKLDIERIDVSPLEVVDDVAQLMRPVAGEKGIGFELDYEGPIPERIRTDPTRLRQILMNLVGNGIKFTDQGGVRVATRLVCKDSDRPMLRFDVQDTGPGLSPDACTRVFETFSQADASTSRMFGGTGLGLAISSQLARLLGGDLSLDSIEGRGSTFKLTIDPGPLAEVRLFEPVEDESDALETLTCASTPVFFEKIRLEGPGGHILLVEDGEDNRRLIALTLEKAGFEVSCAINGAQGVELALSARHEEHPFDLIVMDMQMPVLDGYEATRRLRQEGYEGPIIALTAHAMKGEREKCLAAGCDHYAPKPVNRRELVAKVVAFLSKNPSGPTCDE
jgi:signal transduction histidine kinase/ActR/RegA family two-component response regulator